MTMTTLWVDLQRKLPRFQIEALVWMVQELANKWVQTACDVHTCVMTCACLIGVRTEHVQRSAWLVRPVCVVHCHAHADHHVIQHWSSAGQFMSSSSRFIDDLPRWCRTTTHTHHCWSSTWSYVYHDRRHRRFPSVMIAYCLVCILKF